MRTLLILCMIAIMTVACKNEPKIDYVLISGKIENPTGKTVHIMTEVVDFRQTINLNADGTFADTLKIVSNGYYQFRHGRESSAMYINTGDVINITLNPKKFDETINYTGLGARVNNYLASKFLYKEQIDTKGLYSKNEKDFLEAAEGIKSKRIEILNKTEGLSEAFIALETKSYVYDYLLRLYLYPNKHAKYTKKENVKPFNKVHALLSDLKFYNDSDFQNFGSYKLLVGNHLTKKFKKAEDLTPVINELKALNTPIVKNGVARWLGNDIGVKTTKKRNDAIYKSISAISTDEKYKASIKTRIDKINRLEKGTPSPVFTNYENYRGGETSLKDLRGKYVYIDVWATWCGPCRYQIPFLKEVEVKYHGKNIAFVGISVDKAKDHEAWVQMVKDKELGGIQLIADNSSKSEFYKDYVIKGIPRFILIDPDGNIVTPYAPRPSDPKLIELFNSLGI